MVLALRDAPALNSSWDEATSEVVTKHYVHLGVAVAGPLGLVVPNVKDAQGMTLRELTQALAELTARARDARCTPAELAGGTITLTNVGVFGVDAGVPILNPGEAAILALGAVQRRPWEFEGAVALRDVVTLEPRLRSPPRRRPGGFPVPDCRRRDPGRSDEPRRPRLRAGAVSPDWASNRCSPSRSVAQLVLQVLQLAHQAHGFLAVQGGSAGPQHGQGAPQRLQLVPALHHATNICSHARRGKRRSRMCATQRRRVERPLSPTAGLR